MLIFNRRYYTKPIIALGSLWAMKQGAPRKAFGESASATLQSLALGMVVFNVGISTKGLFIMNLALESLY